MPSPQGYFNQTYTVEFQVPGALDGVTLSPAISATVPSARDPQSIYRPDVVTDDNPDGNLGLIDVDYDVSEDGPDKIGARGNRYVAWFWLEASAPGAPGAVLEVVDAVDGSVSVQKVIADLSGLSTYYKEIGILVPQGSMLRVSGFTGGAKVRLHIAGLTDEGLVMVQETLCLCEEANGDGDGDGCCDNIVFRPGAPDVEPNVFANWADAMAARALVQGHATVEVDSSLVSPAVVPVGTYDFADTTLAGTLEGLSTNVGSSLQLSDGVVLENLAEITNFLLVDSVSGSPVITALPSGSVLLVERGSQIGSSGAVPVVLIPPGTSLTLVLELAGQVTGGFAEVNGSCTVFGGFLSSVPGNAFSGTGSLSFLLASTTLGVDPTQGGFAGTRADQLVVAPSSTQTFSVAALPGAGAFFLPPGGSNPILAPPLPESFLVTRTSYLCNFGFTQIPGPPGGLTYEVLVNGAPVRLLVTDASFSSGFSSFFDPFIRLVPGDLVDVRVVAAGVAVPTDLRAFVGIM